MLKTGLLMAGLTALLMIAGQALGGHNGLIIALVLAVGMNFYAYWFSDKMALSMSRAREVSPEEAPDLHELIGSLASRAGLPKPRVYLIDQDTPNAFATGRNPEHAAVAVTTGLRRLVNRDELAGVISHELGHIKNRDILISSIAATLAGAISSLATIAQWSMLFGGVGSDDDDSLIGTLAMMLLAPLAAMLIQMAISRSREFQADATGAAICGRPESLASALQQLENANRRQPIPVNPATAQMYIVNPLSAKQFTNLFSTHPPIQERIDRLLAHRR